MLIDGLRWENGVRLRCGSSGIACGYALSPRLAVRRSSFFRQALVKTLLCCLGLLAAMCLPGLHAEEIIRTCGVRRAAVEAYLHAHIANVSLVGSRVVPCGDGAVFAVEGEGQNSTGFSDRIVLRREGDSFVANFGPRDGVNTVLSQVKADAGRVELRYRVLDSRRGGLQVDEGAVYLAVSRACAGA
ncbi:hypothetical protein DB345_01985 [Spartobacteria bacterium LR76]|nr:hypothetical protein DB345_01985 [Spartobacteria bacterium LR76]